MRQMVDGRLAFGALAPRMLQSLACPSTSQHSRRHTDRDESRCAWQQQRAGAYAGSRRHRHTHALRERAAFSRAFPHGFEASLLREELEVLKLFKDRLDPAGASDFDLESHVNQDSPVVVLKVFMMVSLKSLELVGLGTAVRLSN